ncbi:Uncharacterised protein [Mycobacteroides abscessus subsp. abscessus]|nr:Uncharacterised protein [Mycobacteroides abscessus subsp. abscessus]
MTRACSHSVTPTPHASAPTAPRVGVCESAQIMVVPGSAIPCSGKTTCEMP